MSNPNFESVYIRKDLKTREIIRECIARSGADDVGRKMSVCAVIHRAVVMLRDSLKGGDEQCQGESK